MYVLRCVDSPVAPRMEAAIPEAAMIQVILFVLDVMKKSSLRLTFGTKVQFL